MSIEDRDWYKEDFLRRQALPDPLKPRRPVKFATAPESAPNLSSGLIFWFCFPCWLLALWHLCFSKLLRQKGKYSKASHNVYYVKYNVSEGVHNDVHATQTP